MRSRLLSCWLCLLVVTTSAIVASEHPRLPSFTVTSSDGGAVASTVLSSQSRWLLIYVSPDCRSCERLIESLKEWQSPTLTSRIVVIVRSSEATRFIAEHRSGFDVAWYADPQDDAWRSLELKSAPTLMGVEGGEIKWTVSGVLNDPKALESVIRKWVE